MDNEPMVQSQGEPQQSKEDWAEAEWFQVWLRLARHEYQAEPETRRELKKAA